MVNDLKNKWRDGMWGRIVSSQNLYKEEKDLILSILEIIWLSEEELNKDPDYQNELNVHWFGFDTLLWILMDKYNHSEKIYSFFRWRYDNYWALERLTELKKYLLELEKWSGEVVNKVGNIIIPNIEDVDCSQLPKIGKFAVEELLKWFVSIPEEKRAAILEEKKKNRAEFVEYIEASLLHDSAMLAFESKPGVSVIHDPRKTAEAVVDLIFDILKESND